MGSSDCVHPGPRNSTRWLPVDSCYTTCSFVFSWKRLYNEMCKVFKQGANARWIIQWKYYNLTDLKTEQTLFHALAHSIGLSQMNELKKWWTKQRCLPFSSWSAYEILVRTYRRMDPWQLHIALVDVLTISASANIASWKLQFKTEEQKWDSSLLVLPGFHLCATCWMYIYTAIASAQVAWPHGLFSKTMNSMLWPF